MAIDTVKVTVNGTTVDAVSNGNGTYTATLAAPNVTSYNVNSGHYYPVTVVATNLAGTSTTVDDQTPSIGSSLRLRVKEVTAPTVTFVSPLSNQFISTNTPTIEFWLEDETNGSGIAYDLLQVKLDDMLYRVNSQELRLQDVSGNQTKIHAILTPGDNSVGVLEDGVHELEVIVFDNDNNNNSAKIYFTSDTVAPTLNVTNPNHDTHVNYSTITVTGATNDYTSGNPTITITKNGIDQGSVQVLVDGSFSKNISLVEGENVLIITATDKAGKTTTIKRTVTVDSSSPVVASVVINPNPVKVGKSYVVTINVTG